MKRVSVVGCSGAGKTAVARRLAEVLGVSHVELDALHWGPNWSAATSVELHDRVSAAVDADGWVVDGNYQGKIGTLVWQRADTVVWIDPPKWRVMGQALCRTVRRVVTRQELWNGNRENWDALFVWRGDESILAWAWRSHPRIRARYEAAMVDPRYQHLVFHRLPTRMSVDRFADSVGRHNPDPRDESLGG